MSASKTAARRAPRDVVLGRVRGVFGVHGWLRVESFTDPPENILNYARWCLVTPRGRRRMCVLDGRWHGPGLVVQLGTEDGGVIADRDSARALMGAEVVVARADLPPLADGEVYLADLIGLDVIGLDDVTLGQVTGFTDTGAHPVLIVKGEREHLVPFVRGPIVTNIDLEAGRIEVNWGADYAD